MDIWRALGVLLVSVVDAMLPTAVVFAVIFLPPGPVAAASETTFRLGLVAAIVVFVGTVVFGVASTYYRDKPFPVTRFFKRLLSRWPLHL